MIYNQTDDWIYIGSEKWKKAFLQSLVFFNADRGYNAEDFGQIVFTNSSGTGSGSATINPANIVFTRDDSIAYSNTNVTHQSNFRPYNYVDMTKFSKVNIKGVYNGSYSQWGSGYLTIRLIDVNGNAVASLYSVQSTTNLDLSLDLTQYDGEYKIEFLFTTFAVKGNPGGGTYKLTLNAMYFS